MMRIARLAALIALALPLAAPAASAVSSEEALARAVRSRLDGDRTGACFAVALIDADRVLRAYECADASRPARIGPDSAFEIGSVTKTMTATLLARLIEAGRASLDDPLASHLPPATPVPSFGGEPIRLRHLVTHTSGLPALPPGMQPADPSDPYASLTPDALLAALGRTTLPHAPGTDAAYSNYGMMLLSYAVARTAGRDFDGLLREQIFEPLGMRGAHLRTPPPGVRAATGHLPNGQPTAAWMFHPDLAGVGGVRATLDDMVRYARAQIAPAGDARLDAAIARTRQPLPLPRGRTGAMNWMRQTLPAGTLFAHEGGTGGFSSLVAVMPERGRAVVILSDTALHSLGGLGAVGMHLLDPAVPMPPPRRSRAAAPALLEALTGEYELDGGLRLRLWQQGGRLFGQAQGQPVIEFGHDDAGDFFPLTIDALLSPTRQPDGRMAFSLRQGGGIVQARRLDAGPAKPAYAAPAERLGDYAGTYPLAPGFAIAFTARDGRLHAQGTGQSALALDAVEPDVFVAAVVGAEFRFERDQGGRVIAVVLRQAGQVLRGARTP